MASDPLLPAKPSRTCPNCYFPLPRFGKYCSHCGQKYTDGKVTVGGLVREFLSDTLNVDSKIWRTLIALAVPGKLTKTFFQGKQQRYIRPLRLFFIFALLTVATTTFFEAEFADEFFLEIGDSYDKKINYSEFIAKLDSNHQQLQSILPDSQLPALDSLHERMRKRHRDSINMGIRILDTAEGFELDDNKVAKVDLANLSVDSLAAKYELDGFVNKWLLQQNIRLQKQGANFGPYILNKTVWMMLLIMPILALVMKLLYVRRHYYYVEHLIFSFHVHAFLFLVLIILMLLDNVAFLSDTMGIVWGGGFIVMQWYFYRSLRSVYRQSRRKTLLKYFLLNICYSIVFFMSLVLTLLLGVLLY